MHSNLRHIRTVEQPTRGRGISNPNNLGARGSYTPRGSSTYTGASSMSRPQRPAYTPRPSFQVSHTPAPTLTTLVGGGADNSGTSARSQQPNRIPSASNIRTSTPTYNYSNQEQIHPPPTRPPVVRYSHTPRPQAPSYQHQTVSAPPPVTHQLPPPTHYQQNQSIPTAITYPSSHTHAQPNTAQTYSYQPPRHQSTPGTSSYIHTASLSTSYAPPPQRTNYATSTVTQATPYQTPASNHSLSVPVHTPVHPTPRAPVAAVPRSAKAMITNLPPNATFGRISSMTETCGTVRTINVRSENNSAVIEFVHPESVDAFIRSYHQQMFDHVMINVYRVV